METQPEQVVPVITKLDRPAPVSGSRRAEVALPERLPPVLAEPLIKAAAFTHGVRQAVQPRSLNRIRFEMRQVIRQRRKLRKQAWREFRRQLREQRRGQA